MSNSPLVNYKLISPFKGNWNGSRYVPERTEKIQYIIIHCVVGQVTVERLGEIFQRAGKNASSNYGVGYDGRIGMYVEEKDRSWCTSSGWADNRGVTIEVASDSFHPYMVTPAAWKGMIKLVADICQRNGIKELKWQADKNLIGYPDKQNMLVHRWFDTKACPGEYLYSRHGDIAREVNAILKKQPQPTPTPTPTPEKLTVNGIFDKNSVLALQKWLNVPFTPDGVIGGQYREYKKYYPNITAVTFEGWGSTTVEYLQKYLKGKGYDPNGIDGGLGPDTIKAWQRWLVKQGYDTAGIDGVFGPASAKAMQKYLNKTMK